MCGISSVSNNVTNLFMLLVVLETTENFHRWKCTCLEHLFKTVVLKSLQLRVTFMQITTKNSILQLKFLSIQWAVIPV